MTPGKIQQLLSLLDELVNEHGMTWREKQQSVLAETDEKDRNNLSEFAGWFE